MIELIEKKEFRDDPADSFFSGALVKGATFQGLDKAVCRGDMTASVKSKRGGIKIHVKGHPDAILAIGKLADGMTLEKLDKALASGSVRLIESAKRAKKSLETGAEETDPDPNEDEDPDLDPDDDEETGDDAPKTPAPQE